MQKAIEHVPHCQLLLTGYFNAYAGAMVESKIGELDVELDVIADVEGIPEG